MTLAVTTLSQGSASAANSIASSSITPSAGAVLVVQWQAEWDGTAGSPSISDTWGLTWTQISVVSDANFSKMAAWQAIAPSTPSAGTVTVTVPAATGTRRHALMVEEIAGSTATTPVAQSVVNTTAFAATIPMALGSAPASTSLVYAGLIEESSTAPTAPTGFTSQGSQSNGNVTGGVYSAYKNGSASQSNSWTGGQTNQTLAFALEILATNPPLDYKAAGAFAYSSTGGSSVAPAYPTGITSDDALVLIVGMKPTTSGGGSCTTPTGWTLQASILGAGGYGGSSSADSGDCNLWIFTKDTVSGSESGSLTVTVNTVATGGVAWGRILRVGGGSGTYSYAADTGSDTSAGSVSATIASDIGITTDDLLIAAMCIPTDVTTPSQFSSESISATGATFGSMTEIGEADSTTGNDIGGFIFKMLATGGPATAAATVTATAGGTTTNVRGPVGLLRVRRTPSGDANVDAVVATVSVSAPAPAWSNGDATVTAVVATVSVSAPAPTVGGLDPSARFVGERNQQNKSLVTDTGGTYQLVQVAHEDVTALQLLFANWYTETAGTGDTDGANSYTVGPVYIVTGTGDPKTLTQVLFGGSSTISVSPGSAVIGEVSVTIAAGDTYWIRSYVVPDTVGGSYPKLDLGAVAYPDETSKKGSDVTTNTSATFTGFLTDYGDVFGPIVTVGVPSGTHAAVEVFGDSIAWGNGDDFSGPTHVGFITRALAGNRSFRKITLPGENYSQLESSEGVDRLALIGKNADYLIDEYGINDLQTGATLAQLQARCLSLYATALANNPDLRIWRTTLTPKSSSTDSWATTTNQTTDGLNTTRVAFNNWLRDGAPIDETTGDAVATGTSPAYRIGDAQHPLAGYWEIADIAESSRDSGIWKAAGTADGIHPSASMHASMAAGISLTDLAFVGGDATVSAVVATVSVAGQAPVVTSDAIITAVVATVSVAAVAPTVSATSDANVDAVVATVDVAAVAPVVTGGANVDAVAATVSVAGQAPVVSSDAVITAVVATVNVAAVAPVVTSDAVITAVAATVSVAAVAPAVSAVGNVNVDAVVATVSVAAQAPVVTGDANVDAVVATVSVAAVAPSVAVIAGVVAVAATVSVSAAAPVVTADATVTAVAATVTVAAGIPTVDGGASGDAHVDPPAATVTVTAPAPVVAGNANVTAVAATVTATAVAPTVAGNATVLAVAATVTAAAVAPVVSGSAQVVAVTATVTVAATAPSVHGYGPAGNTPHGVPGLILTIPARGVTFTTPRRGADLTTAARGLSLGE